MSFKTTIIIAILLILVGGYAYYFEYKGGQKKEEQKEKEKTLFEVKKDEVTQIQLDGIESQPVVLAPDGKEGWKITRPLAVKADQSGVDRILNGFEKVKFKEVIEEQPKDLAAYELDHPKLTVRLTMKGNSQRTVSLGAKNPVDSVFYIRVNNDPRVYLAEGAIGDLSTLTLLDLRDKKLTDFSIEKVQSASLKTSSLQVEFRKENNAWKMVQPVQSPASDSEISSLLSSLEGLRATKFVDTPSSDLTEYGLKEPFASTELVLEKGLRQKLDFGKANGETFCKIEGNPAIAAIGDTLDQTFEKKLEDWREKKVLVFNRFDAEEIHAKIEGKEYSFKKGESDKWTQSSPSKGELEYDQIQAVLEKLEGAEIAQYGDQPALPSAPVLEISISMKDWQDKVLKKHITVGPVTNNMIPVKNDDYGTIVFTQNTFLQDLRKGIEDLKPKPPTPPAKK